MASVDMYVPHLPRVASGDLASSSSSTSLPALPRPFSATPSLASPLQRSTLPSLNGSSTLIREVSPRTELVVDRGRSVCPPAPSSSSSRIWRGRDWTEADSSVGVQSMRLVSGRRTRRSHRSESSVSRGAGTLGESVECREKGGGRGDGAGAEPRGLSLTQTVG